MNVKKVLLLVGVAILLYSLLFHPTQLADGVQTLFGWLLDGVRAIFTFLKQVFDGIGGMLA